MGTGTISNLDQLSEHAFAEAMLSRQYPLVGEAGIERLMNAVVAHAGLGGGGALALEMLARAGIRKFRLLDRDCYEASNLNRQVFATVDTVGRPKVEVAAERLRKINPHIKIEKSLFESVTPGNCEEMLVGADLAMVCTDSPSSHIFFNQAARRLGVRLIFGGAPGLGCAVWVEAHDQPGGSDGPLNRVRNMLRRARGAKDIYGLSEDEALALDSAHDRPGTFTPTISYVPNCSACLSAALAVNYLAGLDTRPHSFRIDFKRFCSVGGISQVLSTLRQQSRR
ncbi:hypothetical protein GF420_03515 [candidate division GN15 bacterium]|nr:hypothetical protein [candidate division GN15 bacterium]